MMGHTPEGVRLTEDTTMNARVLKNGKIPTHNTGERMREHYSI
jgi:hypothetical protein